MNDLTQFGARQKPSSRIARVAVCTALACLAAHSADAATIYQSAAGNWNNTIWGEPAAAPTAGNNYIADGTVVATLGTSNSGSGESFAGDSLTLRNGVIFTASRNVTENFILESGAVMRAANRNITVTAVSTVLVAAGESVVFDSTNREFTFAGTLNGGGNITVRGTSGSVIIANAANTFNGNWAVESGTLDLAHAFNSTTSSLTLTGGKFDLSNGVSYTFGSVVLGDQSLSAGTYSYADLSPTLQAFFIAGTDSITVAPIPEPSTYALLLGGGALALAAQRRGKHRATPRS